MSISVRFWIFFGIVVTSCFISVYCSATLEVSVESDENYEGNLTTSTQDEVTNGNSNRSVFGRCLTSIWEWVNDKVSTNISGMVEDKIISGNPDNVRFYLYPNEQYVLFLNIIFFCWKNMFWLKSFGKNLISYNFILKRVQE